MTRRTWRWRDAGKTSSRRPTPTASRAKIRAGRRLGVLGAFVATLLLGCPMGPDYARPDTTPIDQLRTPSHSAESIANLPWWALYQDEVLQSLIRAALEHNRTARVALLNITEARLQAGIVRADLYPTLTIAGSAVNTEGVNTNGVYVPARDLSLVVDMNWELDLWGRIRRSNEAAFQELLATEEAYRNVMLSLVADVASLYFTLLDLDNRRQIAEQTLETRRTGLETVRARFEGGMTTELDYRQAEIQMHTVEADLAAIRRFSGQTENALSVIIGQPPSAIPLGRPLFDQVVPPRLPVGLASDILRRRPDIRQAERRLHAQTARIGVAEASRFPRFALTGPAGVSATLADPTLAVGFVSFGLNMLSPLFNAGRLRRGVQIEETRTEQLLQQYEQTILVALSEVEDAIVSTETLVLEVEAREAQARSAEQALDVAWSQYSGGMTTYLSVVNVENSLFAAQLLLSEARAEYLAAVVSLYKALGGGWPVTAEDPADEDA